MSRFRDNKWVFGSGLGLLAAPLTLFLLTRDQAWPYGRWNVVEWNFETWRAGINAFAALFVAGVVAYSAAKRSTFPIEKSLLLIGVAFGLSFLVGMISYFIPYAVFFVFAWIVGVRKFGVAILILIAAWSFFYVLALGPRVAPIARQSIFRADTRTKSWALGWSFWSVATLILALCAPI